MRIVVLRARSGADQIGPFDFLAIPSNVLPSQQALDMNSQEFDAGAPVRIPITDVFDLHSVPPRDVKLVVEAYLEEAHKLGFKALRIIHGRGIGVQREIVRGILERTEFVEAFRDAPAEAGGWGATIVDLK